MTGISLESASITDIGKKRKSNQDAWYCNDHIGLYIVADGMGGHSGGDIASRIIVDTMSAIFENPDSSMIEPIDPMPGDQLSTRAGALVESIYRANHDVYEHAGRNKPLKGMGSTVSAVLFTGDTLIVANVGDSPVYLIRDDQIDTLSVSHSMVSDPDRDASFAGRVKHMLTRAVGPDNTVEVDSCEIQCFDQDIIVLCTDGLSNMVSVSEVKKAVQSLSPKDACRFLVDLANENGGFDNTTIIVVKVIKLRHNKASVIQGVFGWFRQFMKMINSKG